MDFTHFSEDSAQSVLYQLDIFAVKMDAKFNGDRTALEDLNSELVQICKNRCDGETNIVGRTERTEAVDRVNDEVYQKWMASLAWLRRGDRERALIAHEEAKRNLKSIQQVGASVYCRSERVYVEAHN